MKKHSYLILLGVFVFTLGACAKATPQPVDEINPGDRIGDFLITTGDGEDVIFVTELHCPYDKSTGTESCEFPAGTMVNVGEGIFDDNPSSGKTLDEYWSEQTHEMTIEGRSLNLQAFGYTDIDYIGPGTVAKIRVWNVVVVTDKPGKITAHSTGVVGGDPFDYTAVITFTAP